MSSREQLRHQIEQLAFHREALAALLAQRAIHTRAHEPSSVTLGINQARTDIARIKTYLREHGVDIGDEPDDDDPLFSASVQQRNRLFHPSQRQLIIGGLAVLGLIVVMLVLRPGSGVFVWGDDAIISTGSGSITINHGDSPEVRQQKLEQAKELLANDMYSNLTSLDQRLQVAEAALIPIPDPLATARQTVAPLNGTPATRFDMIAATRQIESIRSKWANLPVRVIVDPILIQVLFDTGTEPSGVRAFYRQMAEVEDAGDALLMTLESAARNSSDQQSQEYWAQRIAVDHEILQNSARGAYVIGLQTLDQLDRSPTVIGSELAELRQFEPKPPLSRIELEQLRAEIDSKTNMLNQQRLELLARGQELIDSEVATYTALNAQLIIQEDDSADTIGVKSSKLRRLGRTTEALAGFERYAELMASDATTPQYAETAKSLTLDPELNLLGGIYVFAVQSNSAAALAGIQVGDVITTYDGSALSLPDDLKAATELTPAGKPVIVEWARLNSDGSWTRMQATVPAGRLGAGLMAI